MTSKRKCSAILEKLHKEAGQSLTNRSVSDSALFQKIDYVARCSTNRAAVRLLMSCLLAKIHKPEIDIRKPYTEIGGKGIFQGELMMKNIYPILSINMNCPAIQPLPF